MMKYYSILSLGLIASALAVPPVFDAPVAIQANGAPINVGYGKQDLLLGQFDAGKIRFYANSGTNYNPAFGNFAYLQADGSDISLSCG
jgi:hypothetical protein